MYKITLDRLICHKNQLDMKDPVTLKKVAFSNLLGLTASPTSTKFLCVSCQIQICSVNGLHMSEKEIRMFRFVGCSIFICTVTYHLWSNKSVFSNTWCTLYNLCLKHFLMGIKFSVLL